jgi:DNA-binding Lrp family transcriptional regulator
VGKVLLSIVLDELDKKILHEVCNGIYSYDDLAKTLKVTRGTIYRRFERLEKTHVIEKKIMAIPNFKTLNLSAMTIGMETSYDDTDKVIEALKQLPSVKFLWECYGAHNVIAILVCEMGCEGSTINSIRQILSKHRTGDFHVSVGYNWQKVDVSPY